MTTCHSLSILYLFGALPFFFGLGGEQPSALTVVQGQAAGAKLFQQHCVKCHGADGTGKPARAQQPEIPDFTAASWQARRSNAQLLVSILDGKGQTMPDWRGTVSGKQ